MTIPTTELSRIKYDLQLFLMGGEFDLCEDERFIARVRPEGASADLSYGKLILSCWGEGWSRSWRIASLDAAAGGLRLRCTKRMGRATCIVELMRGDPVRSPAASRDAFAERLARMVESSFAGYRVERAITARDDTLHLSGIHTRLVVKHRGKTIAIVGCGRSETQATVDAALTQGLIWLDALRKKRAAVDRLMIFAPRGRATTLATRLTSIKLPGTAVHLAEVDEENSSIETVAPFDQGDLADNLRGAVWPRSRDVPQEIRTLIDPIVGLAPGVIEAVRKGNWVALSIRGLELARVAIKDRRIEFGIEAPARRLDDTNRAELYELIREVASRRDPASGLRNDLLYRAQAERWLETIIRSHVTSVDPTLDPRYVYSQVPAYRGEQRTFIDLLAATREGRLVVMELKVAEDAEFVFQGLDYWLRVEWHRKRGDFERRGYFKGLKIADRAPLLYLVAPLMRFHATTRLIASAIFDGVPVYRVGINEDWRAGVRVLLSERLN